MDKQFMTEAIELARHAVENGFGGPFGAVVVRDGTVVGRGWNCVTSNNDPTAHAEVMAIRDACRRLGTYWLEGCELYVNCEPCMMCLGAIYWAHIAQIYYGTDRADAAAIGFADEYIGDELCRPPAQRSVPAEQAFRAEALEVFELWRNKEDKKPY
jgi:guanine deaminase